MSEESPRTADVERLLAPVLEDGDAFLVRKQEGALQVEPILAAELPSPRSALQETDPALYGYLLAASQRVADASGCGLMLTVMVPVLMVCFGLHSQAFHGFVPNDPAAQRVLDTLASAWTYVILGALGIGLYSHLEGLAEGHAYRRERDGIQSRIAQGRQDLYQLIGTLEGDEGVATLARHLKRDQDLARSY